MTYPNPKEQLSYYRDQLHLRMMGIRKPRLCNSQLLAHAKAMGWLVPGDLNGRNLNFSIAAVRDWYVQQQAHYLEDGVDAFWNDEGEVYYYQFYWWNVAQAATLEQHDSTKRFYSINRAFTPGMQRMGVTIWTGDIAPSWQQLQITPGYMLNWGLMGAPYVTCDIGGFTGQTNALLLSRWYQTGVFLPIMRVHSTESATPHFPFLWPTDAADSMRDSLNLRFQLMPTINSLAYRASTEGTLIMRPLMADFYADEQARNITSQWMMGSGIMAAPVQNQDNSSSTYFPASSGLWYDFNATSTHNGGDTVQISNAGLDFIPVYARAGTVLPLGAVVQSFDSLPGGPLTVHVYAGQDGTFTMVEDDGESKASDIRSTAFTWTDATKTLSWTVSGSFSGSTVFAQVQGKLFDSKNSAPVASTLQDLGKPGSIVFN
jgi:alpha-glucosidase